MASLDKLAVRGIRSFDDKSIAIIQFYTPLTVIVGYNGSGKTTIIECLKYATTGDLPPNTKGGAFVHDPNMAATNEVKAQVRLRFWNTNGQRINCVRNLQVTKKKTTGLTMKTLESLLQLDKEDANNKNKRAVLSTKCAELDEEIPRLLGVSKSILENVIFCHQEESNWPLSEPASLKKKFDDIFEATRYTKALDNIKSLRKERLVDTKVQKAELEGLKTDKERADAIKEKKRKLEATLAEKEARSDELDEIIKKLTVDNKQLYDQAVKFREILSRAESLESKIKLYSDNIEELQNTMTAIDEPEEELKKRKERFTEHLQQSHQRKTVLARKVDDKKDEVARLDEKRARKLAEKGGLESDRKHHAAAVEARDGMIRRMGAELGFKGYDTQDISEARIEEFSKRVNDDARKAVSELAEMKSAHAKREAELMTQWQEGRSTLRAKQAERENVQDSQRRIKDRIKRAQDDLDAVSASVGDINLAEKDLDGAREKSQKNKSDFTNADYETRLREKNREIRDLEQRRDDLASEYSLFNRQADSRARLDVKKGERTSKKAEVKSILDRNSAAFKSCTGVEPKADRVEADVNRAIVGKETELAAAERADQSANKELQHIESALSFTRGTLRDKTARMQKLQKEIDTALDEVGATSLEEGIEETETSIAAYVDSLKNSDGSRAVFERIKGALTEKQYCIGCNRTCTDDELPAAMAYVEGIIQKTSAQKVKDNRQHLAEGKETLALLQGLLPKAAQVKTLNTEDIPKDTKLAADQEEQLAQASTAAEKTSAAVEKCRSELREMQTLKKAAGDITRLQSEIAGLDRDVVSLESDLSSTGTKRTAGDVQADIEALTDNLKQKKRDLLSLQSERDHLQTKQQQLDRDAHTAEMRLAAKRQEYSKREGLVSRVQEFKSELEELQKKSQSLEAEIEEQGPTIRKFKDELDEVRSDQAKKKSTVSARVSRLQEIVKQLKDLDAQANRWIVDRGEQRLRDCIEAIEDIQAQLATVHKEIESVETDIAKIEKDLNESKATERNIHDNLRFLHLKADVAKVQTELDSLNLEEAWESNNTFSEKYNVSKKRENDLNGEAAHLQGEISSLRSQVEGREQELKEDYKHVEKRYTQKLIAYKTGEMANHDLELYAKALDNAIMRYHAIKMEEINEQIRYLWGRTYQGTDIDTISIKSDNEGAKGNRSYHYRVCMVKDTVEMDMRGRCSAGQKVLASIIIRLALADSFGENCGILALDEPTTNLDKENIVALAKSLNDIIRERKSQSNFQLIVITHDEEFLTMLGQSDSLDYYWRCSRNAQQKSVIDRERIQ